MFTLPEIKTAVYAVSKRMQGYHLLRNPEGVSPTELNMIKKYFNNSYSLNDEEVVYKRIRQDFASQSRKKENKEMVVVRFNKNAINGAESTKKNRVLSVDSKDEFMHKRQDDMCYEDIIAREDINFKSFADCWKFFQERANKETQSQYYKMRYSKLDKILKYILTNYNVSMTPDSPNFFKVLRQNLSNK